MKTRILFWLKIGLSVGLLGYLVTLIDLDRLFAQLRSLDVRYLLLAFVLLLGQIGLSSLQWQLILRSDGLTMRLPFLFKTNLIGGFVSLFLPTSFGGDVYRVVAANGVNRDLAKSASSILFARLCGFFALTSICMIGYVALPEQPYGSLVVVLYMLGVTGFLILSSDAAMVFVNAFENAIVKKVAKVLASFRNYRAHRRLLVIVLILAFAFQFNVIIINKVYTLAVGVDVDFTILLVIIPLIFLTDVLPISINGLGVRESAFAFFFVMNGLTVEQAVAVALLVVAERYLIGLVGGLLLLATVVSGSRSDSVSASIAPLRQPAGGHDVASVPHDKVAWPMTVDAPSRKS
jgi:glycosyltransferase 2 family protein